MNDFDQFERQLGDRLRVDADLGVGPFEPASIARAAIAAPGRRAERIRRASSALPGRRLGRGRGINLLAAAALLLVGGALAAGSGVVRLPSIVPPVPAPSFAVVATASPATAPSPSDQAGPSAAPTSSAVAPSTGVWIGTGWMGTPRSGHTAVRLLDGRVLVTGGANGEENDTSAELYDPASGTWSVTGNMLKPHAGFAATLLRDGRVLVGDVDDPNANNPIGGAEVYDPASGTWTATGTMVTRDTYSSAVSLRDGRVLVVHEMGSSELYDPDIGTWTATGQMLEYFHQSRAMVLMPDGKVLEVGGNNGTAYVGVAAELFDPDTGTWTAIANMNTPMEVDSATLLPDGRVLVMDMGFMSPKAKTPELYDPATGAWTDTGELGVRYRSATLLPDGTVLVLDVDSPDTGLYDPATGSWTTTGSMLQGHHSSPLTLLLDGTVLAPGGAPGDARSTELYVPRGMSPPTLPALPIPTPIPTPGPTPIPTLIPPEVGPVPAGARSWEVTVVNKSSESATLFAADEDASGMGQLCGSVTPNVVPAGVTEKVTFLLPPKRVTDCWIWVNPVPGEGGPLFQSSDAPLKGEFVITADGQTGWLSP